MSRRDRGRAEVPRRWPWFGLVLAGLALWVGFRWTNRLLYPGPRRRPGETLKFAEPRPSAVPGGSAERPGASEAGPDVSRGAAGTVGATAGPSGGATSRGEPRATGESVTEPASGSDAGVVPQPTAAAPAARAGSGSASAPLPSVTPRPRSTPGATASSRATNVRPKPRESFDDIDRRTLEAILERRERERRSQKPRP